MRKVLLVLLFVFVLFVVGCLGEPDPAPEVTTTPSNTPISAVATAIAERIRFAMGTAVPEIYEYCFFEETDAEIIINCPRDTEIAAARGTPAPRPTNTPRGPLPTPVRTTPTPPATATLVPTAVPTSAPIPTIPIPGTPGAEIKPYREAPLCLEHDPTVWHGLWDSELGCHHTHEHAASPFEQWVVDTWGGDYTQFTNGQQVSYPWQTFTAHGLENDLKHNGYSFGMRDLRGEYPCISQFGDRYGVSAFFVESHNLATVEEYTGRVHSFFGMAVICDTQDPAFFASVVMGGWSDNGQLVIPYQGEIQTKSSMPLPPYFSHKPPYFTADCSPGPVQIGPLPCKRAEGNTTWSSLNQSGGLSGIVSHHFMFGFRQQDIYFFQNQATSPPQFELFCQDAAGAYDPVGCVNNGSTFELYTVIYDPNPLWDGLAGFDEDGVKDGFINHHGFGDLQGNPNPECHEVSPACTPLIMENVPVQQASVNLFTVDPARFMPFDLPDFDICFLADGTNVDCSEEDAIPSGWIGSEN